MTSYDKEYLSLIEFTQVCSHQVTKNLLQIEKQSKK